MQKQFQLCKDNNGAASVLVILVMIVLITLGLLAMVFANSNYKLAQKTLAVEEAYYSLDSEAETVVAEIDSLLIPIASEAGLDAASYEHKAAEALIEWTLANPRYQGEYISEAILSSVPQGAVMDYCRFIVGEEDNYLEIKIAPLFPGGHQEQRYQILSWQKKNSTFSYEEEIIEDEIIID